jgi:AbiJ-like protein
LKEKSRFSGEQLIQLKDTVVSSFDSSNWIELGALTDMLDEVENHPRLLRSLSWNDPDYDGVALTMLRNLIGTGNENLKLVQEYVAKTCPVAGENISSEQSQGRKIVFSPIIFSIPNEEADSSLVSVMMPFSVNFSPIYEAIKEASSDAGFSCKRVDDIWEHSTVIQDVFSLIFCSHIVVCDFSGKNPNVFYEAGIAHTLGKHVIPITQSENDIPFDLQHHRYLKYLNNNEGLNDLKKKLKSRFLILA